MVAKDEPSVPIIVVEEKRSDRRQSGSFFLAENCRLCSEIIGTLAWRYEDRRRRREDLLQCILRISFGSGHGPFPKDSGHLGCRPSLNPASSWSISPGSIFFEDSESVSTTFFAAPAWIVLFVCFLLSCPCVVLDKHISFYGFFFSSAHVCTCTQHDDTFQQEEYQSTSRLENADKKTSNKRTSLHKRNWHLFLPRPELLSHTLTPFWHPGDSPVLCGHAGAHKAGTHMHAKAEILAADSGLHFGSSNVARLHGVFLGKPRNFILPASSGFIVVAPWHAASSYAADRQAYACATSSSLPSRASKPAWLTEKIRKKGLTEQPGARRLSRTLPSPRDTFSTTQEEKSISKCLYSDWTWKLLTASLATTVDNTIKMADTVQKHGCQWCIRSIDSVRESVHDMQNRPKLKLQTKTNSPDL